MRSPESLVLPLVLAAAAIAVGFFGVRWWQRERRVTVIKPYQAGIEYRDGQFEHVLGAGRYVRWGDRTSIDMVDLRENTIILGGQEVLTADNLAVKLTLTVSWAVEDPRKWIEASMDSRNSAYTRAQSAIRAAVAKRTLEEVMGGRTDLMGDIKSELTLMYAAYGAKLIDASLRDIMLPAELKRAFGDILRARKEGEAALERARGETAALRNLANAARTLKDNPQLANLRLLQVVQASAQKGASIILNTSPTAHGPLPQGVEVANGDAPKGDTDRS